ncbi:hypothetical protein AB0N65_18980 [Paenarthrobacter sp. NPDC089322]|uniref:hypothetical protein n=1 Tax=Paenarthrobacter sp. NPDC089322 TaxID=3155065 RepID=UPI003425DA13
MQTSQTYTVRMVCRTWRSLAVSLIVAATVPLVAGCDASDSRPAATPAVSSDPEPIAMEVNQSRDQYGKQAILLQLTNTTDAPLRVSGARLESGMFEGDIVWTPADGALELPPRQPKSVPTELPTAKCGHTTEAPLRATILYGEQATEAREASVEAGDPYNVLQRNADELCLAAEAAAVASIVLDPGLEVAPDGSTAVVRLLITPMAGSIGPQSLTIESIDGTTLLAELPTDPWPRNVTISAGSDARILPMTIRPARCDPHAVAEDKVGTLLPLRVVVGDRKGRLGIAASNELRARIYDFVTAACVGERN